MSDLNALKAALKKMKAKGLDVEVNIKHTEDEEVLPGKADPKQGDPSVPSDSALEIETQGYHDSETPEKEKAEGPHIEEILGKTPSMSKLGKAAKKQKKG